MLKSFLTAATLALTVLTFSSQSRASELGDLIHANTEPTEQKDTLDKRQKRMAAYQQRMVYFAQQQQRYDQQIQRRTMIQ